MRLYVGQLAHGTTGRAAPLAAVVQAAFVLASVLVATLTLAGCKPVGPDYNRPGYQAPAVYKEAGASTALVPPPNPAGGGWQAANPSDSMLRGKWWEIYQDPQLNQLEERIAANNQSLRQALEMCIRDRRSRAHRRLPQEGFGSRLALYAARPERDHVQVL